MAVTGVAAIDSRLVCRGSVCGPNAGANAMTAIHSNAIRPAKGADLCEAASGQCRKGQAGTTINAYDDAEQHERHDHAQQQDLPRQVSP